VRKAQGPAEAVHHQDAPAFDLAVLGELHEHGRGQGLLLTVIEHDGGAEDVADVGALADEASRNHAAPVMPRMLS
jgi:hypothetical protein